MKGENNGYSEFFFYNRIIKCFIQYRLFLLIVLMGIFLFPQFARLASITPPAITNLTNKKRIEHGLSPLHADQYLAKAAHQKAKSILKEQQFKHKLNNKGFSYWIEQTPYQYEYAGENLAIDFQRTENIVQAWMDSPSHRKNLLNPQYKDIGIAVVEGKFKGHKSIVIVQMLGKPDSEINTSVHTPRKEKNLSLNDNKGLSSTTLEIASFAAFPTHNIFLMQDLYPQIFSFSLLNKNKFIIFTLALASIFFYLYLYFLISTLKSIGTKERKQ